MKSSNSLASAATSELAVSKSMALPRNLAAFRIDLKTRNFPALDVFDQGILALLFASLADVIDSNRDGFANHWRGAC
jgi:hypothetical protein